MISVVCPVLNESAYISGVIEFCVQARTSIKEIMFVDGGSEDNTVAIIQSYQQKYQNIRLLHNPNRTVPFALNLAIPLCTGDVIVRLDAHTLYAEDYFDQVLKTFDTTEAHIVGGPTRTAFLNPVQEAIAYVICTPFGIGGSKVHDVNYEGENDTVTFGSWKRQVFEQIGYFDTSLRRNQDDEFHYRAKSMGLKIYQSPAIKLYYYPRSTLKSLFIQYYQYGLYKPMVLNKIRSGVQLRHLIPSFFVLYLCVVWGALWMPFVAMPLLAYLLVNIFFTLRSRKSASVCALIFASYILIHVGYGLGFLLGLGKLKS